MVLGAILGGLAVVLGAFAAHGLKARLSPGALHTFETGARYQMYHALALLALGCGAIDVRRSRWAQMATWSWTIGVLLFSGSLYALSTFGPRWLGMITPFGGVLLIAGWGFAMIAAIMAKAGDQSGAV
jgi:uncharacterized membrane protein YgdD (TMEM256/DUF423 family)